MCQAAYSVSKFDQIAIQVSMLKFTKEAGLDKTQFEKTQKLQGLFAGWFGNGTGDFQQAINAAAKKPVAGLRSIPETVEIRDSVDDDSQITPPTQTMTSNSKPTGKTTSGNIFGMAWQRLKQRNRGDIQASKKQHEMDESEQKKRKRAKKIAKSVMKNDRDKEDIVEMIGDGLDFKGGNYLSQDLVDRYYDIYMSDSEKN